MPTKRRSTRAPRPRASRRPVKIAAPKFKQYIGISRDHSGSMLPLANRALDDYNTQIAAISSAAERNNIDTVVSVVACGVGHTGAIEREVVNSSIAALRPLSRYEATGSSTPLFQSIWELIEILKDVPDANDPNVSFLVEAITDGQNNSGYVTGQELGQNISRLQATDRWTFVFRVPRGYKMQLASLGIPTGNIQEWDQTDEGFRVSTVETTAAFDNYYFARTKGVSATRGFYSADLSGITKTAVKQTLNNISSRVKFFTVKHAGETIRDFVESKTRSGMKVGSAFYQLTKPEKRVQDHKLLALRDKLTGAVYVGEEARDLMGLPHTGTIQLEPGNSPKYDIFIQSTSVNRRLIAGTEVMFWPNGALLSRAARF